MCINAKAGSDAESIGLPQRNEKGQLTIVISISGQQGQGLGKVT